MKLSAQKMGSMKNMKASLQRGGANAGVTYIKAIPADGLTVRFLHEPEEWFGYHEYWDQNDRKFVPMAEGEIIPDGANPSFRYLACAVNKDDDRVIPIKLPKTAVNQLILKYDKYDTIMDRDYELEKHGERLDTTYDVTPTGPSKMVLDKYELIDLEQVLIDARKLALGEDDIESSQGEMFSADDVDDDDDEEVAGSGSDEHDYGDFDREALFPDGGFREDYKDDELGAMSDQDLNDVLTDWGENKSGRSNRRSDLIDNVKAYQEGFGSEDDDEGEYVEYDEGELKGMAVKDLRTIAADLDIETAGVNKEDLIEAIIDETEV